MSKLATGWKGPGVNKAADLIVATQLWTKENITEEILDQQQISVVEDFDKEHQVYTKCLIDKCNPCDKASFSNEHHRKHMMKEHI